MTVELILLTIVAVSQIAGFTILGIMLYRIWGQKGRRMEAILKEVKEELARLR